MAILAKADITISRIIDVKDNGTHVRVRINKHPIHCNFDYNVQ